MALERSAVLTRGPAMPAIIRTAWSFSPLLVVFVVTSALLLAAGVVGLLVDPRMVLGMPNWAKSTKFGISLLLYGLSLLWALPLAVRWPGLARAGPQATGAALTIEIVVLAIQALRGMPMHFNVATPFDAGLWRLMSNTIIFFWAVTLLGMVMLLFQRLGSPTLTWSVRLGMVVTVVGLTQGFLMTSPNATQQTLLAAGQQLDLIGAHTVGSLDGGPGLPLLGWSTEHGDLRIGHFVGIHGIQAIPLLGYLLLRLPATWLREGHRVALVVVGALGHLGLVVLVTWQALRDQPLLQPDGLTLGALAGLILTAVTLGGLVFAPWRGSAAFTPEERAQYGIPDDGPTCPEDVPNT